MEQWIIVQQLLNKRGVHTVQQGAKRALSASLVRLANQFTKAKMKAKVHSGHEDLHFRQTALPTQYNTSQI